MPSIRKRKNQKGEIVAMQVRVRHKGINVTRDFPIEKGKKNYRQVTDEATAWGRDIEKQIDEGTYKQEHKKHNYTIKEAIEKYIADGNPKTDKANCICALNWFKKEIGTLPIKTLCRSDLKACRNKLMKKTKEIPLKNGKTKKTDILISNSTVNRYLAYFSKFLSYCVYEYEIIEQNPMIGAKLKLKENEPRKEWLKEVKDRQKLLIACKNKSYELYLICFIALTTGARKSEILKLTWDNVDFENKSIYFLNTKNGDDRTIAMPDVLYTELDEYKKQSKIRHLKNDLLFLSLNNTPREQLVGKVYPKVIKEAGLEKITFHGLRHTYTSIGSLSGINTDIMDKITGHRNGRMTSRYTHSDCESLREPMNKIANYMLGIENGQSFVLEGV